jgi:hypothetical protein
VLEIVGELQEILKITGIGEKLINAFEKLYSHILPYLF